MAPAAQAVSGDSWTKLYSQGQTELAAKHFDKAIGLFRQAVKATQTNKSVNSADNDKCMQGLADALSQGGRAGEAQDLYRQLLSRLTKKYGANSAQIAPILMDLGSIQESAGDHTTAIQYYERALKIREKNYGPYSPAVAKSLENLGRAQLKSGNRAQAAKNIRRSMSVLSLDPGLTAAQQLQELMKNYADLLKGEDRSNEELMNDFQKDILKNNQGGSKSPVGGNSGGDDSSWNKTQRAPVLPGQHSASQSGQGQSKSNGSAWQKESRIQFNEQAQSETSENSQVALRGFQQPNAEKTLAPAYNVINDSLFNQTHYEKGVDYYQRMIAADIDALGPHHPSVANDLNGLGQLYMSQQKYNEAEPLFARALKIYDDVYGANNLLSINTRISLAAAEFQLGQVDKAAELYRSVLSNGQSTLGPNSSETANILNQLAYLYFHQGKLQEARTFYEWALASTKGAFGEGSPLLAACLKDYSQVLRSLGQNEQASEAETRADKIISNNASK